MRPTHLPNPHKLRALIVYSHRQTADTLGQLFVACGQEVLVAYEGTTACDLARTHRPDVVLLDLRMQDEEVAWYLRRQTDLLGTALVAIAAPGGEAALRLADQAFSHYLIEPVDPAQVLALLKKLKIPR